MYVPADANDDAAYVEQSFDVKWMVRQTDSQTQTCSLHEIIAAVQVRKKEVQMRF